MSRIPKDIVERILETARIEEVIGEFVQLKRAGTNLKGLSPFTDEKTPSFVVSPVKQIFKCFSTSKGGNVASFLMEKEHFSYPEALRWLAKKYGIDVPAESEMTAEQLASANEKDSLFIINEFAKTHFVHNLMETTEGKNIGLSYFEERGYSQETISKFQLGYCLNTGDDLTKHALKKGFKFEYLDKIGLSKEREGRKFDFFKGRVLFPIHSISGRILGFGGRTLLADKKVAKYFNSPESPVYSKSEILYGLYFAKGQIIKADECLLCEGYTDVISMNQAGCENVVSSSGTSLTKEQIKLISRYTKNVTILFDGDSAGIKASFRGIDLILQEGLNVKVVLFPDGEDPDSFSKKNSAAVLNDYLSTAKQDFISFKSQILLKDAQNDPIKLAQLIKEIIQSIALIPDTIIRTVYAKEISTKYDFEESMITQEIAKIRRAAVSTQRSDVTFEDDRRTEQVIRPEKWVQPEIEDTQLQENELMRLLLLYGDRELVATGTPDTVSVIEFVIQELLTDELEFSSPICKHIFSQMALGVSEGILYTASYFRTSSNQEITRFISETDQILDELSPNWEYKFNISTKHEDETLYNTVLRAVCQFKLHKINQYIFDLRQSLKNTTLSDEERLVLLGEQVAYEKIKKVFSEKLGRIINN